MENAAAYTMLVLGGNAKPTADQVKAVVVAGGKAEPDEGSHEGSGADGGADATGPYATTVPVERSADQLTEM